MELPINLLINHSPRRQRYIRIMHILFGAGGGGDELSIQTREQLLNILVKYLKEGLSVRDIHYFRRCCEEHHDWCIKDYLISTEDETAISSRADMAMQTALSIFKKIPREDIGSNVVQGNNLTMKRGRLETLEFNELREQMQIAEVFANIRDYGAMNRTLKNISNIIQTLNQETNISQKLEFAFVQLEIMRRSVELWLGSGDLESLRSLIGASMNTLIIHTANLLQHTQSTSLSLVTLNERYEEEMMLKFEEFILFFSIVRALCMFEDRDFTGFAQVFTSSGLRGGKWASVAEDLISKWNIRQINSSLISRVNTLGSFPPICYLRSFVEEFITSGPQLGVMVLFSAIVTMPRMEAIELIMRLDVMQLWEDVPDAQILVKAFKEVRYSEVLHVASSLVSSFLKTDIFAQKNSEILFTQFKKNIIAGYVNGFTRLDLDKAAIRLSIFPNELEKILRNLIMEGRILAKMDLVENVLIRNEISENTVVFTPQSSVLLECIHHSDKSITDLEQSLRVLSLQKHFSWC